MAEDEKTPETEATTAPEAAATDAAPEAAEAEATPSQPAGSTRRERLDARREARRPAARGPVTGEQREEERRARRSATAKQRSAYRAKLKERRAAAPKEAREPLSATEHGSGRPKERQGVVSSAKGDKTITVLIDVTKRHRRYHKIMRSTQKLYAHDEANTAGEGDTVRIVECRPMSRTKRWRLADVLERAK
jgi:small subunit ribosomal protein S17